MKTAVTARIRDGLEHSPLLCAFAGLTLLIAGCGGGGGPTSGGGSANPAPTVNLGASPNPVNPNGTATLTWSAPNATTCTASGDWNGPQPTSGSVLIPGITNDKVYTLTCTGSGGSGSGSVTVAINQPPVANNACHSIADGGGSVQGNLSATDPNGGSLTYTIKDQPLNGIVSTTPDGAFTYTPNPNGTGFRGMDKFTFNATDTGGLDSQTGTVTILNNGQVRIMPLGDSITDGFTGSGPLIADRIGYRKKLFCDLEDASPNWSLNFVGSQSAGGNTGNCTTATFDTNHEGHGGWCDDNNPACSGGFGNISDSVQGFLDGNPADIILLHIGTNQFDVNSNGVDTILNRINTWAASNYSVNVYLARIVPTRDETLDVNTFNNGITAVPGVASDRSHTKVHIVNQQNVLAVAPGSNNGSDAWYGDNLHPNETGYDRMADEWKLRLEQTGVLPSCQ